MHAAVHLDLDGAADIFRVHGWKYDCNHDPLFETGLRHALEFFAQTGITATLFVISQDLENPRKRALLEEAVRQGHEIASHTVTHRHLIKLSRDEKRREIFGSRERLSLALGVEVRGFRAPGFHIDRESLELIAEAGYGYDSSTFPNSVFERKIGASLSPLPSHPIDDQHLIEFCLPAHNPLPLPFHPSFSLVLGMPYFRLGFRLFNTRNAPMILLFHLTDFADPLPPDMLSGWQSRIYTLSHLSGPDKRRRCMTIVKLVKERYQVVSTNWLLSSLMAHTEVDLQF